MRFAIAAADRYIGVFQAFVDAGWDPVKLFTVPLDNVVNHNQAVIQYAADLNMDIQLSRMSTQDLQDLQARDCEVLIVASYNWRVPDWRPYLRHAINFHPSPLPIGRGPYPFHQVILEGRRSWGVSCHQLAHEFDSGDILAQRHFPLTESDCHETLSLRTQMAARELATQVAFNFQTLWDRAQPQDDGGSYWKKLADAEWLLKFDQPVAAVLRRVRAFGQLECIANLNNTLMFIRRAVGWTEVHHHASGTIVYSNSRNMVVAADDGYIGIVEWSLVARNQVVQIGR
ncbi:formyltransferase family protein [Undibacterium sp.]|jgi:methionyl-tRNA formyltransferase|uniref:formyltransferase family protein n=1 Tax=Undibacterium sp. TaxID=1914977 RepID=UPI002CD8FA2A|nr:formyltransferase family protein [Undibacterium sp.]HTD03627.1 formyltransferase family protein [Undibacterium sp.]